ncbi:MAG: vesicle coat component, partial [Candelina submexicana]
LAAQSRKIPTPPTSGSKQSSSEQDGDLQSLGLASSTVQAYEGVGREKESGTGGGHIAEIEQGGIIGRDENGGSPEGFAQRALYARPLESATGTSFGDELGLPAADKTRPQITSNPGLAPEANLLRETRKSSKSNLHEATSDSHDIAEEASSVPAQAAEHGGGWSDDIAWDIGRSAPPIAQDSHSDTDPFIFLGQVNHTNSFPDVPPAHNPQTLHHGQPLPQSQVETILEQDDGQESSFDQQISYKETTYEGRMANGQAEGENLGKLGFEESLPAADGLFNQGRASDSGEPSASSDAEARFEEGIPLMPTKSDPEQKQSSINYQEQSPYAPFNPFEDSADADENLFNYKSPLESEDQLLFNPPPLDRKSTTQVLGSLNFLPHQEVQDHKPPYTNQDARPPAENLTGGGLAVSSSTVASQVLSERPSAQPNPVPQELTTAEATNDEDLAALWKAALEEDEFLDDELLDAPDQTRAGDFFANGGEDFFDDPKLDEQVSKLPLPVVGQGAQAKGFTNLSTGDLQANGSSVASTTNNSPLVGTAGARPSPSPYAPFGTHSSVIPQNNNKGGSNYPHSASFTAPGAESQHSNPSSFSTLNQPSNSAFPQPRPVVPSSSQSYADQSKGGYSSPYDLPTDISRPRKRVNLQHAVTAPRNLSAPGAGPPSAPPPRSSSMYASQPQLRSVPTSQVPAAYAPSTTLSKPFQHQSQSTPTPGLAAHQRAAPITSNASSRSNNFFEDLPTATKARPSSGASRYATPPKMPSPPPPQVPPKQDLYGPPSQQSQRQPTNAYNPTTSQMRPPERINPYAAPPAQSPALTPPSSLAAPRYSPAPPPQTMPPQVQNRYTPPSTSTTGPSYSHSFQPRTSSPLAYQERPSRQQHRDSTSGQSYQGVPSQIRSRTSSQSSGRRGFTDPETSPEIGRKSLDIGEPASQSTSNATQQPSNEPQPPASYSSARYAPESTSASPPPPRNPIPYVEPSSSLSYARIQSAQHPLHHASITDLSFAAPQRSQTQSPGSLISGPKQALTQREPFQRPASAHAPSSPTVANAPYNPTGGRGRGFTQPPNYISPTDGRELDPLQRWRGCPVFVWGFGGLVVSSFPKEVPRYGTGQIVPMIKSSPGEVKLRSIKDVYPLDDYLSKFPGPLRAKGKKKDVVGWLDASIKQIQVGNAAGDLGSPVEGQKRHEERILLWKVLRVFVEHDGVLEANPAVEKAVRLVLSPEVEPEAAEYQPQYATGADSMGISKTIGSSMRAEPVDAQAVEELRQSMLKGDRERAVWHAVDKRLWAHAMLISSTLNKQIWKQVIQEFVRQEVKNIGDNTESLAALYEIFAGNWEESIDELVPPSARAGHQMVSTAAGTAPAKNALDGLDRWRETLGLVLSNRSTDDGQALMALGGLLAGYGRVEAAHICYIFARSFSVFGGADDPKTSMTLLGADHVHQPFHLAHTLDPLLLSEVYEFALSLAASSASLVVPHLQAYKLYHATILAEYGYRAEALEYCLAIANGLKSTTKPSPYYNSALFASLDDLTKRLQQSPKDGSSGWISAPSMGKVSNSVWSSFEKFIAGDESNNAPAKGGLEVGPFSRIAGDTPVISRSSSNSDIYGAYGGDRGVHAIPGSNSRYAPAGPYAPRSSFEQPHRTSQDPSGRSSYDPGRSSIDSQRGSNEARRSHDSGSGSYEPLQPHFGSYEPKPQPHAYQPTSLNLQQAHQPHSSQPTSSTRGTYAPTPPAESQNSSYQFSSHQPTPPSEPAPAFGGYQPQQESSPYALAQESSGNEPHSASLEPSGYEPPTTTGYQPYSPPGYDAGATNGDLSPSQEQPKKKVFTDDDEDDYSTKPAKDRAQKDKEADAAFKKAAAEDAKKSSSGSSEKKGWFGGWFSSSKKDPNLNPGSGPIRAKLGEESSFYYDSELKKWVNKKAGAEAAATPAAPPPPPKGGPRAVSGTGAPPSSNTLAPPGGRALGSAPSMPNLSAFPSAKMMPSPENGASSAGTSTPPR